MELHFITLYCLLMSGWHLKNTEAGEGYLSDQSNAQDVKLSRRKRWEFQTFSVREGLRRKKEIATVSVLLLLNFCKVKFKMALYRHFT